VRQYGRWKDIQNQREFFDRLAIKWNIQKPEEWNKVTYRMAVKEGATFIKRYYKDSLQRGTSYNCNILTLKSIASDLS
jgi:hypothetical protein